jgi:uncharacterized UBP type Zn finger protein
MSICEHLRHSKFKAPSSLVCAECVEIGSDWVHLRTCLTCGHVGCCDSSPHRHATAHFRHTHHPVMASAQPGEHWLYCYVDEQMAQ